jgi:hypothetical protein
MTGSGPASVLPTGLDSTIPLQFPPTLCRQTVSFLSSLLKVNLSSFSFALLLHDAFSGF